MGDNNTEEVLNTFFCNIDNNQKNEEYSNCDPLANMLMIMF